MKIQKYVINVNIIYFQMIGMICKLVNAVLLSIPVVLVPLILMFLGSAWDRGDRNQGNIRSDIPSTIGLILGMILVFAYDAKIESLLYSN